MLLPPGPEQSASKPVRNVIKFLIVIFSRSVPAHSGKYCPVVSSSELTKPSSKATPIKALAKLFPTDQLVAKSFSVFPESYSSITM